MDAIAPREITKIAAGCLRLHQRLYSRGSRFTVHGSQLTAHDLHRNPANSTNPNDNAGTKVINKTAANKITIYGNVER